jgi:tetratricopeptide (TPR) repeat protein
MTKPFPITRWLIATVMLLMLGVVAPAAADYIDDGNDCAKSADLDLRIRGCTGLIQSGEMGGNVLAAAYMRRGFAYRVKGDTDRAIADFDRAIQINPNRADSYMGRGLAYRVKGDTDRAIADFDRAIQLDPNNANAYFSRGAIYGAVKDDFDRAIADYDKAIEIKPDFADSYIGRGLAYADKGDLEKALIDLKVAARLMIATSNPLNAMVLDRIAEIESELTTTRPLN